NARVKPPATPDGGPTVLETRHLLETIRFTLGTVLLQEARLLPKSSPERAAALVGAEEIVRRLAGGIPGEAMTWNGRVLLAESARLRGDVKQTLALISSMEKENPPLDVLDRLLAVQMRTLLDQGRPDEAASRLVAYQKQRSPLPGE